MKPADPSRGGCHFSDDLNVFGVEAALWARVQYSQLVLVATCTRS